MAESKTARASRVSIGETRKDPFDTPEKKIAELRKQREAKLFVNRVDFIDALLAEYDARGQALNGAVDELTTIRVSLQEAKYVVDVLTADNSRLVKQHEATIAGLADSREA